MNLIANCLYQRSQPRQRRSPTSRNSGARTTADLITFADEVSVLGSLQLKSRSVGIERAAARKAHFEYGNEIHAYEVHLSKDRLRQPALWLFSHSDKTIPDVMRAKTYIHAATAILSAVAC